METPWWMWTSFFAFVFTLLVIDLKVLNKKDHEVSIQESVLTTLGYVFMGVLFGGWIWYQMGAQAFMEYITGFLVEKTLSVDNIFVMSMIFSYFSIPLKYQHRVLFYGILGVIFMRAIVIALGAALVAEFEWILYAFSLFLVGTGIKMLLTSEEHHDITNNVLLKWMRGHLPITEQLHDNHFIVQEADAKTGKLKTFMTPLLVALILIECADLMFAVDSIPAIFTITTDTYIVYTSNIFAILGLRALYFSIAAAIGRFHYLKTSLALVLIFIGAKIFAAPLLGIAKVPPAVSLTVTMALLTIGCLASIIKPKKSPQA